MPTVVLSDRDLALKSIRLRKKTLEAVFEAGGGHTGGSAEHWAAVGAFWDSLPGVP